MSSEPSRAAGGAGARAWEAALARFELSEAQLVRFGIVLDALARDEHAPTALRDVDEAARSHLADSLVGLDVDLLRDGRAIADLGAGAGFPGLALAVAMPDARLRLVESKRRKCEFVRAVASAAGIANATVVCSRAEEWSAGIGANDAVVARALAPQPVVLEYAAPLLALGGGLIDWRGRRNEAEELAATAAASALGMRLREIRRVRPFAGATDRHLHVFVKERETPARFPRRAGVARKRPLGA
ncbi:MAG TPA: 16S rRNA (guanine(527)-N(7))-methyltransferase RsmG [Solirubrobacteraceae bacterium]|jgi:16S rRNA (guanine527-N7)-methyltransferase|nr:16S rRNA (guanine(527)-N(7))-methyltransferase RsmG [Solirubrobacteraceae bacterium]